MLILWLFSYFFPNVWSFVPNHKREAYLRMDIRVPLDFLADIAKSSSFAISTNRQWQVWQLLTWQLPFCWFEQVDCHETHAWADLPNGSHGSVLSQIVLSMFVVEVWCVHVRASKRIGKFSSKIQSWLTPKIASYSTRAAEAVELLQHGGLTKIHHKPTKSFRQCYHRPMQRPNFCQSSHVCNNRSNSQPAGSIYTLPSPNQVLHHAQTNKWLRGNSQKTPNGRYFNVCSLCRTEFWRTWRKLLRLPSPVWQKKSFCPQMKKTLLWNCIRRRKSRARPRHKMFTHICCHSIWGHWAWRVLNYWSLIANFACQLTPLWCCMLSGVIMVEKYLHMSAICGTHRSCA